MSHLSAHADYRHEDYFFARSQSRALSQREWEHSAPLHSWSEIAYPVLAAAGAAITVLGILY
jgi:sarcosine oxidase delta subunit